MDANEDCIYCLNLDQEAFENNSDMAWASDRCADEYTQCVYFPTQISTTNNFEPIEEAK